jgi:sporulation protein YlmC with PRC-barrel domain
MKELLGAVSALVLLTGVALAQNAVPDATTTTMPPAATPAPAQEAMPNQPPADPMPQAQAPATPTPAPADTAAAPPTLAPPETAATPPTPAPAETAATPPTPAPTDTDTDTATAPAADTKTAASGEPVSADDMMGREVEGSDGQPLGKISDVVVDSASGKIQRLVIASGGFLGLGAKNVAVAFEDVEIRPEGGIVAKGVTQADIDSMPEFNVTAETAPLDEPPAAVPTTTAPGAGMPMGGAGSTAPAPAAGGTTQ